MGRGPEVTRIQEAAGGPRRPQEVPGGGPRGPSRPQKASGGPRRSQEAPGGPKRRARRPSGRGRAMCRFQLRLSFVQYVRPILQCFVFATLVIASQYFLSKTLRHFESPRIFHAADNSYEKALPGGLLGQSFMLRGVWAQTVVVLLCRVGACDRVWSCV